MGRADGLTPGRYPGRHPPLTRAELPVDTVALARYLIGKLLLRETDEGIVGGHIVETEAYDVGDAAGHAYRGVTPRNRSLFLERGHAYVYLAYGSAYMLNVSSETAGIGAGVLIRALEPCAGIAIMQRHRHVERLRDLARGPGRLAAARRLRSQSRRHRAERPDRGAAGCRAAFAILSSRQSVCQRAKSAVAIAAGAAPLRSWGGPGSVSDVRHRGRSRRDERRSRRGRLRAVGERRPPRDDARG